MTQTELAPAKVNLTLHVTGQRADGYHLLDSLVVFTQTGDRISCGDRLGLSITGPEASGLSDGPDNLVQRAARLMCADDVALVLEKNLPVASGIGGGSSDAAATLRLLGRVKARVLPALVDQVTLGADVPVCVLARPARMQGIGDVLSSIPPLPPMWLVLVNPRIGVSTPSVFRALTRRDAAPMPVTLPHWRDFADLAAWLTAQRNDLQAPACGLAPAVATALDTLRAQPDCALARMSGSGATCFGLFPSQAASDRAAAALRAEQPGWWISATGLYQGSDSAT